jgi:hypothetical protein
LTPGIFAMPAYPDLVSLLEKNLTASRFKVAREVTLPDETTADLAAARTTFSWKGLVVLSQHFLVRHLGSATPADFYALFDTGFIRAKRVNRVPLVRGMQFGYMVVPFIAVDAVTPEITAFVASRPRRHWSLFEFPVLYDLSTGEAHFYEKTGAWGAFYFSNFRALVRASLAAA